MHKNKYIVALLLLFITTILAEEVVIKIATIVPEGSIWVKSLRKLNKDIKKKTNGRVRLKIYSGGIAGNEKEMVDKIQRHKLDGALFLQAGIDQILPQANLLKLPYFYKNHKEWQKVQKKMTQDLEDSFLSKNIIALGWLDTGFAYLFTGTAIHNLNDFRKSKTWLYPDDPLIQSCFRELKVKGISLETTAVKDALKNKELNCVYASPYLLIALRWHSYVRCCIDMPISNVIGGLLIDKSAYDSIPQKYRKTFAKTVRKHMKLLNKKLRKENKVARRLLKDKYQMQFIKPDAHWSQQTKRFGQKIAISQIDVLYSKKQLSEVKGWLGKN